ncbi:ferritin-like domain-containing protein [Mesonia sp.]|uniref:ferritin-like domain-containing protein n=1 Tax=Mesonia sp. TaxID=1960830 RepID=UPI001757D4DA|nr:ferritin-like domain-containing protein [Mesonia sp.]HIB38081.1 ferritin-like domain-containing protein [Mesonia sp.]HIO27875.1 ferritin-like domain-containing protein [Flavobacteriaceae bacterium]
MNLIKFLDEFTSDNLAKKGASRRDAFSTFSSLGKKAAIAAVPFGMAVASNKAKAATMFQSDDAVGALQLALTLEYLEASFYLQALDSNVLDQDGTGKANAIYEQISMHESAHVTLLQDTLMSLGETPVAEPTFDFTAGGNFDPFNTEGDAATSYAQLLALAQAFEDTGVRAYKGQAGALMGNDDLLTAALQIHSVEARHASEIRRLRGLQGWITLDNRGTGMPAATQPVYDGEENLSQGGVDVSTLGSGSPFTAEASSQAYDEILTGDEATTIASLFIES